MNSCTVCRQRKRKCDRARPSCSSCTLSARVCTYDESPVQSQFMSGPSYNAVPGQIPSQSQVPVAFAQASTGSVFASPSSGVDPYQYESLRHPAVDLDVSREVLKIFLSFSRVPGMGESYFNSAHHRMTIMSKKRFFDQLPTLWARPKADYMALCLCMHLIQELPFLATESMQSSIYVTVKSTMSLLMAVGLHSLNVVQCWVLVVYYELGHAIHPAASMSLAACAKLARSIGLHRKNTGVIESNTTDMELEERKRVWWAIVNLERFINLCDGDALFGTEDPNSGTSLPVEDSKWIENSVPPTHDATLATSSNVFVGQFARECQVSHLVGRVVRHVFDPTPDQTFHEEEALQLERTLTAFMPLLIEEEFQFGKFCAALGICSNGLFMLYEFAPARSHDEEEESSRKLSAMEPLSTQIVDFSRRLFNDIEAVDIKSMSPFVPYSLYQAAVIQHRLWSRTRKEEFKANIESLKSILGSFRRRWLVAGRYLTSLESSWPPMMMPSPGFNISSS